MAALFYNEVVSGKGFIMNNMGRPAFSKNAHDFDTRMRNIIEAADNGTGGKSMREVAHELSFEHLSNLRRGVVEFFWNTCKDVPKHLDAFIFFLQALGRMTTLSVETHLKSKDFRDNSRSAMQNWWTNQSLMHLHWALDCSKELGAEHLLKTMLALNNAYAYEALKAPMAQMVSKKWGAYENDVIAEAWKRGPKEFLQTIQKWNQARILTDEIDQKAKALSMIWLDKEFDRLDEETFAVLLDDVQLAKSLWPEAKKKIEGYEKVLFNPTQSLADLMEKFNGKRKTA